MIFGMTSASALGNIPQKLSGCIVNTSQASQFMQEDELRVWVRSGVSFLLDNLLHIGSKGWRAGVLGFREQLYPSLCACCRQRRTLMKSRENYSCWALWSQGHVLHLQGRHGIIQGVACPHSVAEGEIFFTTTSDTWFARGRARDQQHWWAGLVFLGHNSTKPMTLFWLLQKMQQNLLPSVNSNHTHSHQIAFACYTKRHFSKTKRNKQKEHKKKPILNNKCQYLLY